MLRRVIIVVFSAAISFGVGCTSSDREYMRNHVVQLPSKTPLVISPENTLASNVR